MCNTAPLLKIDFQAIEWHKRSDRRQQPDIPEQLKKVKGRDTLKTLRGSRMSGMKVPNSRSGISQVGYRLPGPISIGPTFPVHQILHTLSLIVGISDVLHFVFLFAILHNIGGARSSYMLSQ